MIDSQAIITYLKQLYLDRCFYNMERNEANPGFYEKAVLKAADELTENTKFIQEGFIDSLGLVSLRSWLEEQFDLEIPDEIVTLKTFATVKDIVKLLEILEKKQ